MSLDNSDHEGAGGRPGFQPNAPAGLRLPENFQPTCEADFFKLFFTPVLVTALAVFTSTYAWMNILDHPNYGDEQGTWVEINANDIYRLLALLFYMGVCWFPTV